MAWTFMEPAPCPAQPATLSVQSQQTREKERLPFKLTSLIRHISPSAPLSKSDQGSGAAQDAGSDHWFLWFSGILGVSLFFIFCCNYLMKRRTNRLDPAECQKKDDLKQARNEIEAILSSIPSMVLVIGQNGIITRVIPTGYSFREPPREMTGRHVGAYLPQLTPEDIRNIIDRTLTSDSRENLQLLTDIHRTRWLDLSLTPLKKESVLVVANDITDIKTSRQHYQDLVELAHTIIFQLDREGRVTFINRFAETFFGYPQDELLGRPAVDTFMAPIDSDGDNYPPPLIQVQAESDLDMTHRTLGGELVYVTYRTKNLSDGTRPAGQLWVGNDVTAQRLAQAELIKRERYYRSLIENASEVITLIDADGRIISELPTVQRVLDFPPEETAGRLLTDFIHPEEREEFQAYLDRVLDGSSREVRQEHRRLKKDGTWVYLESLATNLLADPAVKAVVINSRNITKRRQFEEELRRRFFHDPLTGLPNRALFIERLKHAIERYRRRGNRPYSVLFVDVDRFKMINDSLGHNVGDRMLKSLADVLINRFRKVDTVARFGSDEFVVLLDEIQDDRAPITVAERIMDELKKPIEIEDHDIFVSVSIGIAYGGPEYEEPTAILRDADTAMHQAKLEEKGGYRIFHSQMHSKVRELLKMETDLRRALDREEFRVHYQPIIDMRSGHTTALEALIRWQHPEKGQISPMEFIPMAEDTGLIVPIGEWILKQACRETQRLLSSYTNGCGQLSLNLSPRQFMDAGLVETILNTIKQTGVEPGRIKLEITETTLMQNGRQASLIIEELKSCGLSIAIDDFGTGYSSLSYLQQFPFDTLKIDRSFIRKLHESDDKDINIINIILSLARSLSMDVVAEGIETVLQRDILMNLGCHTGQGFYYAKPMDIRQLETYLTENSAALN